jgi:BirA family transcriptional regulator, biotin operon repressor / biotin---[acetyl-CoA-carboxylase] ligase
MPRTRINPEEIEHLLRTGKGYMSGAEMASRLGVTRAAVWKTINLLKNNGYVIESSPSKGYRLVSSPDLCVTELEELLSRSGKAGPHKILHFESVASTNSIAMDMAEHDCPEGAVLIADTQTAGKGRLGRSWLSPAAANLYMSMVVKPNMPPRDAAFLTLIAAVACASAIRNYCGVPVSIKWPNDLLVGKLKIVGILAEIRADMDRICHAVVGIGVNVNLSYEEMPDGIKKVATSVLIETGRRYSRTGLAAEIISGFDEWLRLFLLRGKKVVIDRWSELSSTLGSRVRIAVGDMIFEGTAKGIDSEGLLIVRLVDGSSRKFSAGDVTTGGVPK